MIDLNKRRANLTENTGVTLAELEQVDLTTLAFGDWIEGIGPIQDYAILGLLHQLGRMAFGIKLIQRIQVH